MTTRIITAHVLDGLAQLEDESVNCIVTSPPYYGLRSYKTEPQIWDAAPCEHEWGERIAVNATNHTDKRRWQHTRNGRDEEQPTEKRVAWLRTNVEQGSFCIHCGAWRGELGLEPDYRLYVAHIVEIFRAVRRVLRSDGVVFLNLGDSYANDGKWGGYTGGKHVAALYASPIGRNKRYTGLKPKDLIGIPWRTAFALQDDGWWLRKDNIIHKRNPMPESIEDRTTTAHEYCFHLTKSERYWYDAKAVEEPFLTDPRENYPARAKITGRGQQAFALARGNDQDKSGGFPTTREGRNRRSVWTVSTSPTTAAHFATMPEEVAEIAILAGCPVGGVVLDPFMGTGTTLRVAERFGRDCIGIDLQPEYVAMAERRTREPGFAFTFQAEAAE